MNERIARVFPRKTEASPTDELAFFGPPGLFPPEVDEVRISVSFSYDMEVAEKLALDWEEIAPVNVGGPAIGDRGAEFTPGFYLKPGYVITSRGCPNSCWYCDVHQREGDIRELEINSGWNVLDSNLLACSEKHTRAVFDMLGTQVRSAEFTGGLEARRLKEWHVSLLWNLRPKQIFFAYDKPEDLDPLIEAGKILRLADFTRKHLRCYVLIGHPRDTIDSAKGRLIQAWEAGFMPMAMLWRSRKGNTIPLWKDFQRKWVRPMITKQVMKAHFEKKWRER